MYCNGRCVSEAMYMARPPPLTNASMYGKYSLALTIRRYFPFLSLNRICTPRQCRFVFVSTLGLTSFARFMIYGWKLKYLCTIVLAARRMGDNHCFMDCLSPFTFKSMSGIPSYLHALIDHGANFFKPGVIIISGISISGLLIHD